MLRRHQVVAAPCLGRPEHMQRPGIVRIDLEHLLARALGCLMLVRLLQFERARTTTGTPLASILPRRLRWSLVVRRSDLMRTSSLPNEYLYGSLPRRKSYLVMPLAMACRMA